jgi:hypothetical protein
MTDVFPLPLPTTLAIPTSTQQFANAYPGEREHCGLLLTNMSIAGATWRNGVRTLNAILKFPCFRLRYMITLLGGGSGRRAPLGGIS